MKHILYFDAVFNIHTYKEQNQKDWFFFPELYLSVAITVKLLKITQHFSLNPKTHTHTHADPYI